MTDPVSKPHRRTLWRFAPLALIAGLFALAFATGLHKHISLEALRQNREALEAFVAAHRIEAIAIFAALYIIAVAISLPLTLWLSLAGGFLFGAITGGAVTWISATIGATLIFLAARTAFADALRSKAQSWLGKFEAGFKANAFNYLLALRLFPGAPFFIVNLVPAFLGVKLRDYVLATLIGIIPGTFVYASVGAGLRAAFVAGTDVDPAAKAREIFFSPIIIGPVLGLIALSLLPILAKAFKKTEPAA